MSATVAKPQPVYRLSRAELRLRWEALDDDPIVAAIPCKVELNEKGVVEVSPPTTRHGTIQAYVARELARQRPEGTAITECPVETDIGMRMPDVVWASAEFMARHGTEKQFRVAPDLCVEVLSPTNTRPEWRRKQRPTWRRAHAKSGSSATTASQKSTPTPAECPAARSDSSCRVRRVVEPRLPVARRRRVLHVTASPPTYRSVGRPCGQQYLHCPNVPALRSQA